jgi:NPL4 family, putative zinc binding region
LDEKKIKHMSFHGYLRKLVDGGGLKSPFDEKFIAPLEEVGFGVLVPCPGGNHSNNVFVKKLTEDKQMKY